MKQSWTPWIVLVLSVAVLIYYAYLENDCINGKECKAFVDISSSDPPDVIKSKIRTVADRALSPTIWPLALVVGLATSFPLIYFVTGRNPRWKEFFAGVLFIFIGVYFVYSWTLTHFFAPNLQRIVDAVDLL